MNKWIPLTQNLRFVAVKDVYFIPARRGGFLELGQVCHSLLGLPGVLPWAVGRGPLFRFWSGSWFCVACVALGKSLRLTRFQFLLQKGGGKQLSGCSHEISPRRLEPRKYSWCVISISCGGGAGLGEGKGGRLPHPP